MFNPEKISTNESSEDSTERNLGKLALQNDLAKAGNELAQRKHERFQNQRIQEQIERDLNQRFTTVDKLEEEVTAENPEILKYSVDYEGEEIPVYDLRGVPFSLLTHDIEYRRADKKYDEVSGFGLEQSRRLFQDPSLWMETEEEARKDENYNSERANMNVRGNVISMSYIDSGGSLNGGSWYAHDPHIIYGFSHLDGKRLRNVFNTDGGTSHYYDEDSEAYLNEHTLRRFQSVISADYSSPYNEFLVDRYSEIEGILIIEKVLVIAM